MRATNTELELAKRTTAMLTSITTLEGAQRELSDRLAGVQTSLGALQAGMEQQQLAMNNMSTMFQQLLARLPPAAEQPTQHPTQPTLPPTTTTSSGVSEDVSAARQTARDAEAPAENPQHRARARSRSGGSVSSIEQEGEAPKQREGTRKSRKSKGGSC